MDYGWKGVVGYNVWQTPLDFWNTSGIFGIAQQGSSLSAKWRVYYQIANPSTFLELVRSIIYNSTHN